MKTAHKAGIVALAVAALTTPLAGSAVANGPDIRPVAPIDDAPVPPGSGVHPEFIGGEPVSVKDHPYVIAGLREGGTRPQGQTCTGSAIAPRKILIAAHCADAEGEKSFVYGLDDLNQGQIRKIPVVEYLKHPKYVNFDQGYDVAVVTTGEDIPVPEGGFAKVATSADTGLTEPGKQGFGLGYGKKNVDDSPANVELHRGDLPIVDAATCSQSGLQVNGDLMVCTGTESGRPVQILPGDSGGPLVVDGTVVGVGSWSASDWSWYSIYGRLNNEMGDWVQQQIARP
ncbi:S1 family peptidase [Saccharopolyspora taberi]|uniref:Serine protease n=1 Tax=Saccharopolyspora taberi TaxID=60895 RepID=A0ABN3V4D8_9PSEU